MPEQLVKFLTYVFLALLYLFFLRVLRAVWMELREPKPTTHAVPQAPQPVYQPAPDPPRGRRAKRKQPERLRIIEPPELRGPAFDLPNELTVGRAAGCTVSLPKDTFVSQIHARVFRRDHDVWIEDLGSTNGTFLNERKVSAPAVLHKGDRLKVGRTVLEVTR